jgi:excisionase family DNA binding protein
MDNGAFKQQNDVLTTKEVAGMLGVHNNTVRRWSDQGFLKSYRITNRGDRRFKSEDISSFLNNMNGRPTIQ